MTAITIIWRAAPRQAIRRKNHRLTMLPPINADYLPFHDHIDQRKNVRIGQMFHVFHRVFFSRSTMLPVSYYVSYHLFFYLFLRL